MSKIHQDFIVDKLTDSIINTISRDSFETEVSFLKPDDLLNISQNQGWNFNWEAEFDNFTRNVYKLTILNNPTIIQGLLSLTVEKEYVFMNLLESSPFNIGKINFTREFPGI